MDECYFFVWFPQKWKLLTMVLDHNYVIRNSDSLGAFAARMFCTEINLN